MAELLLKCIQRVNDIQFQIFLVIEHKKKNVVCLGLPKLAVSLCTSIDGQGLFVVWEMCPDVLELHVLSFLLSLPMPRHSGGMWCFACCESLFWFTEH